MLVSCSLRCCASCPDESILLTVLDEALLLMENSNRRTLILWSAGGMLFSSVALVLSLLGFFSKMASLSFVIAYVSFFEIGLGPM